MKRRLFIGTKIYFESISQNYYLFKDFAEKYLQGKWVEPENLHFTYWFIGEIVTELALQIKDSLNGVLNEYSSLLEFKGISSFPSIKRPRVIFIKVHNEDRLIYRKYEEIKKILGEYGFTPDGKGFKPHCTLIRVKSSHPQISSILQNFENKFFGKMENFQIQLIESKLTKTGPVYTPF